MVPGPGQGGQLLDCDNIKTTCLILSRLVSTLFLSRDNCHWKVHFYFHPLSSSFDKANGQDATLHKGSSYSYR